VSTADERPVRLAEAMSGSAAAGVGGDVAAAVAAVLHQLGVRWAFGVCGGAIARMWAALLESPIEVVHCRHETGAGFAAIEASVLGSAPAALFTTTGPGLTNAVTALTAARVEGAKLVLLSPRTSAALRGRTNVQETSAYDEPLAGLFTRGPLFDLAVELESPDEIEQVAARLAAGFARAGGYIAHIVLSVSLQGASCPQVPALPQLDVAPAGPTSDAVAHAADLLDAGPFAVWLGVGARAATTEVRELVARTGAPVICSPRAKGIVPDDHPQFVGVTGIGGHDAPARLVAEHGIRRTLVLGSRLGEQTSGWDASLVPPEGFVHVDIDPHVPGTAFPEVRTFGVLSEVGAFVQALLAHGPLRHRPFTRSEDPYPAPPPAQNGPVHPAAVMAAVQRVVLDGSDAAVLADPGSAMAWAPHLLRVRDPRRWRLAGRFASMGQATAGVLGAAVARRRPAVCITGDGSLLMTNEISTAATYGIPVSFVVLNDARYGMAAKGMAYAGHDPAPAVFAPCDFVSIARGMGGDGARVEEEGALDDALRRALRSDVPFVVDVVIDHEPTAPFGSRLRSLERAKGR
jgi:acetolactate synthase I/II/III large subunit